MSKLEEETKNINNQNVQAERDLIKIGRGYVQYLPLKTDSGNISVVILNDIVIILAIFGTISTAKAVTNKSNSFIKTFLNGHEKPALEIEYFCNPKISQ